MINTLGLTHLIYFKLWGATCFGLHRPSSGPFVNRVLQMLATYWDPTMFTTLPVCVPVI